MKTAIPSSAIVDSQQPLDLREQQLFRTVMGRFATGVVLVTAQTESGPAGMTVNSFTSVSLDPPMIALCAAYESKTWPRIRQAGSFGLTFLGEHQEDVCRLFSQRGEDRFRGHQWSATEAGHPTLSDALAWVDCRISATHPAGDHELVLAETSSGYLAEAAAPLIFHSGQYNKLARQHGAPLSASGLDPELERKG